MHLAAADSETPSSSNHMRIIQYALTLFALAGGASFLRPSNEKAEKVIYIVDTVFVKDSIDYDAVTSRVLARMKKNAPNPTVIDGDLIVKGRLGVRGAPEPETDYAVTVHGSGTA